MAGETVLGSLRYEFTADTSGLKSGLSEVTSSLKKVTDQVRENSREFKKQGEDAAKSIGLAKHEMVNLTRQLTDVGVSLASGQSPFMVLIQQGTQIADIFQSSKATAGDALKDIAKKAALAAFSIRGLATASGAIGGVMAIGITHAKQRLAELSEQAKTTGISVQTFLGAEIVGARSGVEADKMGEALANAGKAFEQYTMNAGELRKEIQALGGDFMRLTDQTRNAGQFVDVILQKVRELPRVEGMNLAKKLFGDDQGAKLFDAIRSGEVSMANFARVSGNAGGDLDGTAKKAAELKKQIEAAAAVADTQLLAVFGRLAHPVDDLALSWSRIKIAIAEAAQAVRKYHDEQVATGPHPTGGEAAKDVFARMRGQTAEDYNRLMANGRMGRLIASAGREAPDELKDRLTSGKWNAPNINDFFETAGDSRNRFAARDKKEDRPARAVRAKTDEIKTYLDNLREAATLAQAEADNWSKGNLPRERAVELSKLELMAKREGRELTAEERANAVKDIEQKLLAEQKTEDQRAALDRLNDSMREFADLTASAMDALVIQGQKASEVLRQLLKQLSSAALRGLLTGDGMFGNLFGLSGSKEGGLGGLLGKAVSFLPKFAAGGTLGAGRWGIAGEAGPELIRGPAHVTPFGKMGQQGAKVTVHNYSGAPVQTRQMSDGEILVMVGNMIQSNNKRVPGLVADAQRRSI